jgi:hypothetical protein
MINYIIDFINSNGIVINTFINSAILLAGIISIIVIWKIFKIQKRDQLSYLQFRDQQEEKKRKREILPQFKIASGGYTGADFNYYIQIIENTAKNMRIEYDENKFDLNISISGKQIYSRKDLNTSNNMDKAAINFRCKDMTAMASVIKPEYEFYLYYTDKEDNNYKSLIKGNGIFASIGKAIECPSL